VADLDKLEKGIPDLENFRKCIEIYVGWWVDVDMRQGATADRSAIKPELYDESRLKDLQERWEKLIINYRDYVRQVSILFSLPLFLLKIWSGNISLSDRDPAGTSSRTHGRFAFLNARLGQGDSQTVGQHLSR
jgi:hypothetical protein